MNILSKSAFGPSVELIGSLLGRQKLRLTAGLAALLISSGSLLVLPKILGQLIDANFTGADPAVLHRTAALVGIVATVYAATATLRTYMMAWVGQRLVADIRSRVFARLLDLPLAYFETRRTGDLLARLTSDVAALDTLVGIVIPIGLRSGVQLAGALALMTLLHWRLTALILLAGPFLAWAAMRLGHRVRRTAASSREGEADVVAHIEATLNAMATVKAFAAEKLEAARFQALTEASFRAARKLMRARACLTFFLFFFALNLIAGVVYLSGFNIPGGALSWGELAQFLIYLSIAAFGITGLSEIFSEIKKTAGATERLFAILSQPPETGRRRPPLPLPPGAGAIVFDAVEFAYPARPGQPVLCGFNLTVQPGEKIALVGPSGAGKTTLLRLTLRLFDPQAGRVLLDGADLRDLDPRDLRLQMAVVSQEPVLFSGTARENIAYGRPAATEAEIVEAARLAQAHEFIAGLPAGYDTPLGERGQQLSTGQRQRLAIARALVRRPRVLILDEATSAMDSENERLLRRTLLQGLGNRTVLIVAHRLATVQAADRVVVLDRGRIQGQGPHAQLLRTCPLYAHLVAMEFGDVNGG